MRLDLTLGSDAFTDDLQVARLLPEPNVLCVRLYLHLELVDAVDVVAAHVWQVGILFNVQVVDLEELVSPELCDLWRLVGQRSDSFNIGDLLAMKEQLG